MLTHKIYLLAKSILLVLLRCEEPNDHLISKHPDLVLRTGGGGHHLMFIPPPAT